MSEEAENDIKENNKSKNIKTQAIQYFKVLRKYFVLEPIIFFIFFPAGFLSVAIPNFGLEKTCRVNFGYNQLLCDKALNHEDINCEKFNNTELEQKIENITNAISDWPNYELIVCQTEIEINVPVNFISGIRAPIAAVFLIIVNLYAGGWSDKYCKRKPCMILPLIGEVLGTAALLISSILFDTIPMEFANILEKLLPAILGGPTLLIMGIYSYIIDTTREEDRIFRLGIFAMFATAIPIVGTLLSDILLKKLGYIYIFTLALIFVLCGVVYLIVFVDEVEQKNEITENSDKFSFKEILKLSFESIKIFFKKRDNNVRMYLVMLAVCFFLTVGPTIAEIDYLFQYTKLKLNWQTDEFTYYSTYSQAITTVGTFIMTTILSKLLKVTDSMIGLLACLSATIARILFALTKDTLTYYIGGTLDMFSPSRTIALKTIFSMMIPLDEIGRVYSALGIMEPIASFIFPPIYSSIFTETLISFPGTYFIISAILFVPTIIIFGVCYVLLKNKKKEQPIENEEQKIENGIDNLTLENDKSDTLDTYL